MFYISAADICVHRRLSGGFSGWIPQGVWCVQEEVSGGGDGLELCRFHDRWM